jgi:integrase
MENQIQKFKKESNDNQLANYKKLQSQLKLISEGQEISRDEMRRGFIGLAQQNQELVKLNKQLTQQLETVVEELNQIKQERREKEIRKQTRANRKRLPKRDPMTAEIYKELIKEAEGPTYLHVRLRLALCLLAVTGVRINELLNIKVSQLKTLTQESWIAIDRSKRGPSNHKAFLTKEGKKIIQDRKKDFEFILLIKEPDAYVFTSEAKHYQKLRREAITKER